MLENDDEFTLSCRFVAAASIGLITFSFIRLRTDSPSSSVSIAISSSSISVEDN